MRAYAAVLACLACTVAGVLVLLGYDLGNAWIVVCLAVVNAVAERGAVPISKTTELSIGLLPTLYAAILFGPLAGGVVNAASMLGDSELLSTDSSRSPRLKLVIYASLRFLIGVTVGFATQFVTGRVGGDGIGAAIMAALAGALLAETLDVLTTGLTARIRGRQVTYITRMLAPLLLTSVPLYAPIVAVLVVAYEQVSPWTAPLFFVPALAAQRLFGMYHEQRQLSERLQAAADDLADANTRLEKANLSFAAGLVRSLEAKDMYTAGHSAAVAIYCRDIATRMGLAEAERDLAFLCGLVHDVGKIGLPAALLDKNGPLTLDERRQMQEHSAIGERILREVDTYADIAGIVRFHHERMDGEGYPDGIAGDEIPLISRIIAVADAYNAMTSDRPYRDAMPSRVARLRLAQAVETQFDTTVVAAFEAILAGADEEYRRATREDFLAFTAVRPDDQSEETSITPPSLVSVA